MNQSFLETLKKQAAQHFAEAERLEAAAQREKELAEDIEILIARYSGGKEGTAPRSDLSALSIAEAIYQILSERRNALTKGKLFDELRKRGVDISYNTLGVILSRDERFDTIARGVWHLKK